MKKLAKILASVMLMVILAAETACAAPGQGAGVPGVVSTSSRPGNADIVKVCQSAGLTALGTGNMTPDPILGLTPLVGYAMKNFYGNAVSNITSSAMPDYVFCADGFEKLYMDMQGVGRIYFRVYSAQHGWSSWANANQNTNTNEDGSKVQALQIRMKGYIANLADVYYKVVLNDGTVLDWASNGQTTGTMGTDKYIVALSIKLWPKGKKIPAKTNSLMCANAYEGMYTDKNGQKQYSTFDGRPYTGWVIEGNNQYYFLNSVLMRGWAYVDGYKYLFDQNTGAVVKDLEPILGKQAAYQIKYNKGTRTMYVMALDADTGQFCIPFKTFLTTCGPDTPLGTYNTYAKYDWKFMHASDDGSGDIYCQKLTRFYKSFLMHSLLYYKEASPFALDAINYNYMDFAASGGCIRLRAGDAKWIYDNLALQTSITIYDRPLEWGPIEKEAVEQAIPREQNYDPTDEEALAMLAAGNPGQLDAASLAQTQEALAQAAADDAAAGIVRTE